jgi:hypothetical protein
MRRNKPLQGVYASSEVIGGLLLIVIAVLVFAVIRVYMFPDLEPVDVDIKLEGYVTDQGIAVVEHVGGESLKDYKVLICNINGSHINSKQYLNLNPEWKIGDCKYPLSDIGYPPLINKTDKVEVIIYTYNNQGGEQEIFRAILSGNYIDKDINKPILLSSLMENSPDEDIICFGYPASKGFDATTYIYNWMVDDNEIADLILPFDLEDNYSCKDYSDEENDGTLNGASWIGNGKLGGACYLDGLGDYISFGLPNAFNDISNNDFTISAWIKINNIVDDNEVLLTASKNINNFVKIFLLNNEIHIGICKGGVIDSVRTDTLNEDEWYHIAGVWDASKNKLFAYCNGALYTEIGDRNFSLNIGSDLFEIGHGLNDSKYWDGYIDELEVFNRAFSQEQIYQIYLSINNGITKNRVIVSEETIIGESWQCIVTPNFISSDGSPVESNSLQIVNYPGGV